MSSLTMYIALFTLYIYATVIFMLTMVTLSNLMLWHITMFSSLRIPAAASPHAHVKGNLEKVVTTISNVALALMKYYPRGL